MKFSLRILLLLFFTIGISQTTISSKDAQISVLTFGAGDNLNDAFGHNAIRIKTKYADIAYDFGRYNFADPNFYLNFARGKLLYLQGKSNYKNLVSFYINQNRTIKEQILNLSTEEKQALTNYLESNFKKNEGAYLYDFFYDNCATRIRDVVETTSSNNIHYTTKEDYEPKTFRNLIDQHLDWNTWGSFGIDIALGSIIDREATVREQLFLPEKINQYFETAILKESGEKLVSQSTTIYAKKEPNTSGNFFLSPLFILLLVAIAIIFITYKDHKNKSRTKTLDAILFCVLGAVGTLIFLLWFATDHTATAYNYNLLWAFPVSLFCINQALKTVPKKWFIGYIKFSILMLCLLTMHWIIGVQSFAPALIPLLIALVIRYVFLIRHYRLVG